MKPTLTAFLFLIFAQITVAQYIPFPDSVAKWSMGVDDYDDLYADPFVDKRSGYLHEMNGDTIIDGINYNKIYERPTWWRKTTYNQMPNGDYNIVNTAGNYPPSPPSLLGVMRQDTVNRKVYFRLLDYSPCIEPSTIPFNVEFLLFDFDLAVGDTVYLGLDQNEVSHIIESIDSVQYNDGIYRKRYSPEYPYPEFNFIEGIGTSVGLFAGIREAFVEGEWCQLNCYSENGIYIIGNGIYNCDSINVLIPVIDIDLETKVNIYPNPFDQLLQIDFEFIQSDGYRLLIYNSLGQLTTEKFFSSSEQYFLNTQDFSTGIYFVSIYSGEDLIATQKITKSQ